jgi:hypothetical protein
VIDDLVILLKSSKVADTADESSVIDELLFSLASHFYRIFRVHARREIISVPFDSSVGRAVDCRGTEVVIHRSLVQIRLEG